MLLSRRQEGRAALARVGIINPAESPSPVARLRGTLFPSEGERDRAWSAKASVRWRLRGADAGRGLWRAGTSNR